MEVVLLHKSLIGDRRWQWVSHVPRTWHHHQHYDHQNLWSSWGVRENVIPLAAGCWAEESWNVLRNIMNDDEEQSSSCSKSLSMVVEVEVGEDERGTAAAIEKAAEWTLQLWIVQCPDTSNSAHHFGLWQWFKDWYWGNHGGGSWSRHGVVSSTQNQTEQLESSSRRERSCTCWGHDEYGGEGSEDLRRPKTMRQEFRRRDK